MGYKAIEKMKLFCFLLPLSYSRSCDQTSTTESGRTCQKWNRNYPFRPKYKPTGSTDHNNCAAADPNDPKPFCYTTDREKRWEYCDCTVTVKPPPPPPTPCSKTRSGIECQRWDSSYPHQTKYRPTPSDNNYCANPDNDSNGPWCYTTDKNKRFEYCDIDNCSQPPVQSTSKPVTVPSGQCGKTSVKLLIDEIQMENYSNYDSNGGCKSDCQRYRKKRDAPDVDEVEYGNIVGGVGVDSKELPWQATLNLIGCGATIVSQTKVITASHCLHGQNIDPRYWKVKAGHITRYARDGTPGLQEKQVRKIVLHPRYNRGASYNNDIAIMITDPFTFTAYVQPACLPSPNFKVSNGFGVISGFGTTSAGGSSSNRMLMATIPLWSRSSCKSNRSIGYGFTDQMICGGEEGKDTCQGDSGGPLVVQIEGKWTLIGVTSWGIGCGGRDSPGVYANVAKLLPFINNIN